MDKPKLFQIGDVAKLFHLSVSSLRHYENVGLLTPEYIAPDTGYRYYSPRQFEALNTILSSILSTSLFCKKSAISARGISSARRYRMVFKASNCRGL